MTVEELKSLRVGDIILSQTPRDRVKFYCGKAAFPMEQLPVVIAFEAGKKELAFEQLQQVHEGYTFELDQKPDEQVQILANGHCIGQGEWVQINDRLGVRVTHLSLK